MIMPLNACHILIFAEIYLLSTRISLDSLFLNIVHFNKQVSRDKIKYFDKYKEIAKERIRFVLLILNIDLKYRISIYSSCACG